MILFVIKFFIILIEKTFVFLYYKMYNYKQNKYSYT